MTDRRSVSYDLDAIRRSSGMRKVTVCDACLTASCWQGVLMCEESQYAGTTTMLVYQLRELDRESSDYWKQA